MDKKKIIALKESFDSVVQTVENEHVEYWYARDIMLLLGYLKWENFEFAVKRAMESCQNAGGKTEDHFRLIEKSVVLGSGAQRVIQDYMLTRYACYLIAQNGDPRKEEIAFAQSYFAIQTRRLELIEERVGAIERLNAREQLAEAEKRLSKNLYERGVDEAGFARIRSKGDEALFGVRTGVMKRRLGVTDKRPLADFLPTLTVAAKGLATEMTSYNVEQKDLQGERPITKEHVQNNASVRNMLGQRGIKPEELPPAEDIKKLERHVKAAAKKNVDDVGGLPE